MNLSLFVQIFMVVIVIGMVYTLWRTSNSFGGLIGNSLRFIGIGILFFSLEALDRVLGNIGVVSSIAPNNQELVHQGLLLFGLLFSGIGFSKLTKIAK